MIIQAGFDLELLAHPLVVQGGKVLPRLVLVSLDAEMQLDGISIVTEDFKGALEPHRNEILDGLDPARVKFFAIAHAGCWPEDDYYHESPILQEAEALKAAAVQRGFRMIGHFGIDETGYMAGGPHSYFDQYGIQDPLPQTMDHWVHSKHGKCGRS
jgi:hypothetical protein